MALTSNHTQITSRCNSDNTEGRSCIVMSYEHLEVGRGFLILVSQLLLLPDEQNVSTWQSQGFLDGT